MNYFLTSFSGWLATILIGLEILLPYLLRRSRLSDSLGFSAGFVRPYLQRMKIHYWLGYLVLILSGSHAWIAMEAGNGSRNNGFGIWYATATLGLLALQNGVGFALQRPEVSLRKYIRGWHYRIMTAIVLFAAAHIWLNS
jgi:hypothetical protein